MVPIASQLLTLELQLHTNSRSMDENLKIQRFEVPPSASDFEFLIESRDVPAVLVGCVKDWRAVSEWNPYNGGLDNLQVVFQRSRCYCARVGFDIFKIQVRTKFCMCVVLLLT
ncbi:uncharacterized protein LOC111807652 isoform X4 [Cucurbita pepo subsp. pepo]|uniref:uncharacterized protein LOC111807652 isoform X4 n=1 Tax=Cucurbita pepo subsp. pepo TaxID=3664 RepID=UPI000C9D63D2|nr:uncharacterized protein LOC111807652 isoform X4 [Cucurbita pepo subsp. pepo]